MSKPDGARMETRTGERLILQGVRVDGVLNAGLLDATVTQRFRNPRDVHVEVVYSFPLPWASTLLGVEVQLGERHLTGVVVEKRTAEAEYEEALSDGNRAVMLEQNQDESFTLSLGNLGPGESCAVCIRYAQALQFEQGALRLLIPMVIAPRYGDPIVDARLMPHQTIEHDLMLSYPFDIVLKIEGELARCRVSSPTHPIATRMEQIGTDSRVEVSLARKGELDRDFVLVVSEIDQDSFALLERDFVEPEHLCGLVSFCPRIDHEPVATALKILVDCSGSMQGDSIAAARRALQGIVTGMADHDRFSLSRFGSSVEHRSRTMWRSTEKSRRTAQQWIADLEADLGGTELEAALLSTFALSSGGDGANAADVLLITDGEVSAIDAVLAAAGRSEHRMFIVGIGSSPAEGPLRRLAEATGGVCDFVAPGEAVEPAILRMFARLRSPRVSGIELHWPDGVKPLWATSLPNAIFDGDTVRVFAGCRQVPTGDVVLLGRQGPDATAEVIGRARFGAVRAGDMVSRIGCLARLDDLEHECVSEANEEATRLAVAYQLVARRTNFLLIDEIPESEKPTEMPELAKVKSMVPAGWGGMGSVRIAAPAGLACSSRIEDWDVPAVIRSTAMRQVGEPQRSYDIPHFLRGPFDIDRSDPRYWIAGGPYRGLTPLGLCEWLRGNRYDEWPSTYEALEAIGVGAQVIGWLATLGQPDDEEEVVEAFLKLMALPATHKALLGSRGLVGQLRAITSRLAMALSGKGQVASGPNLETRLAAILEDMRADHWPDVIISSPETVSTP
ncbi:VIT domain-containing protein [Aromatoleum evansii]|uniref:VIT domain-containing protein n=1 Tax=Aromatoleum evansii TaxID=59406 RepID=UPI00145F66F6|nr:VIT domain-containing protein [Aromatoleum evansii]NMG31757.1 VWA domain-containing protein [Aromatoleum evansii]